MNRTRRARKVARPLNLRDLAEAMAGPNIDSKTWVSSALVNDDACTPSDFDDDLGPLISCTLQPSDTPVYCRVLQQVAGDGEGEYAPYLGGDEVLVALPHGRPDAAPVILGRLNNGRQKWPKIVGGQDATQNNFGFKRRRTPYIEELSGSYMLRQGPTGAFLSIDAKGIVTVKDGSGGSMQLSPDVFGYQSADAKTILQLDVTGGRATLQVQDAKFTLASSSASPGNSSLLVPKILTIATSKNGAVEHAVSTEAVFNIVAAVFDGLATVLAPIAAPLTGAALAALIKDPIFSSSVLALVPPIAANKPLLPLLATAIQGAFAGATQKPGTAPGSVSPSTGQLLPGIGCAGLLLG